MPKDRVRSFSRDFKVDAVMRMLDCDNITVLAREVGVRRKLLYDWRNAYLAGGADAFRGKGRPRQGSVVLGARNRIKPVVGGRQGALAAARSRITQLERKVGQQAFEADICRNALQQIEAARQAREQVEDDVDLGDYESELGPVIKADLRRAFPAAIMRQSARIFKVLTAST
jgi:transposase-like protein